MELNKNNLKKIIFIVFFAILFNWILKNYGIFFNIISSIISTIFPFILGACIAFILNILMVFFERKLFKDKIVKGKKIENNSKLKRPISMILSILSIILLLALVIGLVIPELIEVISQLIMEIPKLWDWIQENAKEVLDKYPTILDAIEQTDISIDDVNNRISSIVVSVGGNILNTSASIVSAIFGGIFNFIISIIFSIYILLQKEKLKLQSKKIVLAYLPEEKAERFLYIAKKANTTFVSFITGQFVEAIILGSLCCIGMLILRIPYAVTIGVLVGFTALIPVVGAFIGIVIGSILILSDTPRKVIVFIIFVLILQQFEGNIIYPKVVGNSVGLPAIWVLFAITVGGATGGIIGILLSVPIFSIIYTLLKEDVSIKLENKKI